MNHLLKQPAFYKALKMLIDLWIRLKDIKNKQKVKLLAH